MSDGTVDNLNIQISAEAKSAEKSLNSLSSTLLKVNKNLQSSVGAIRKVSKEVGTLQSAVKSFSNIGKINVNSSGIGKTMNSLKRLLNVDTKNFDINGFKNITEAIRQIGNMPDVSNNVNRFVSALARLANAGNKTGQTANSIKRLGEQTRLAAKELKGIGSISSELNMFVQSIGRLASAGNKTGQTASSLRNLAKETLEFFNVMSKAPRISQNTIAMTQALAQLANAGGRVSTATNTISTAFNKLSSVGGKTLNAMKKVASGIVSAFKNISTSGKHIDSARFSLWNLAKTAIGVRLGYGVYEFAREAINLGSAITEVENVVDVSFGSMADKAYEFASTAKEQFGLSELAAKQYSGTMMAMLNASGVARDAAAEMSIGLAGLAGDLASFYNISTDEAFYKLRSAIAGEVEPMRQLGVSMTVANLQAYALSQGITKSWQSMTQAEQAMLRYNYIMSVTGAQQGDYARTVNTFANQWRLLTLNVRQFSATVGQGVIAAVLPAIQALNALFSVLQKAAQAFRDFMYVLTGYKGQGSQGGVVNDLGGIGDMSSDIGDVSSGLGDLGSAGDTASGGLDEATNSAEELKKALSVLSFDELNQLSDSSTPNLSTPSTGGAGTGGIGSGGGSGLGGLGGSGIGGLDSITDALGKSELPEAINEWAERIRKAFLEHDWDKLGEEIAWGINKGMQAIYDAIRWENVGPKITKFINAFTTAFNSLVDNINFDLIGRTVGAGINTIVRSFNLLVGEGGIDFNNIGKKLSDGLRGAINEISWRELGNALGNGFMIAWDIFSGFIFQMSQKNDLGITGWEELGKSLGKAVKGLFEKIDFDTIAMVFADGFNGVFEVIKNFNAEKSFEGLGEKISKALNHAIGTIKADEAGKALSDFVISLLDELLYVAENTNWELFGKKVGEFLGNIDWIGILTRVIKIISEVLGGLFNGLESSGLAGSIASWIAKAFILVKVGKPVLGLINTIGKIITGNSSFSILSKAFKTVFRSSASEAAGGISGLGNAAEGAAKGGIGKLLSATGKLLPIFSGATMAAWAGTEAVKALNKDNVETAESTQVLSDTLMTLKNSGDITSKQWDQLYTVMTNGQAAGKNSSQIFKDVAEKMSELGISTDTAKLAIESAGGSFEQFSSKVNTAKEDIDSTNFTGLISQLDATKNSVDRIDFSQLALNAAAAIDQAKGIWIQGMGGWSQVTGEKALEIYQGIKNGLYPENGQGYYDIGNGVMVSFGSGITEGTEGVKSTLDSAFIQTLQTKLPEGYTIAYQNGQFIIQKYTQGLIDNSGNVSNALNNSTIAKINEILPQGNILSYQNGQWTIQKYAEGINSGEEQANIALSDATIKQIEELLPVGYEIFYNGGTNSIQSFADGITSKKTLVEQTNKSVLIDSNEGLDSKLKEKYSGYAALSVQGYNQKLSELKGETQREVESFATNSIINPFANILKINSPSRVFREFGEYSVEGFEEGFEKKKGDAENIVNNLGRNLQKSMSGFLDSIDKGVRSSEKQITSRFSSIQRSASTVASDIVRAFSNLHIPLPHLSWDWNYIDFGDFSFSIPSFKIRWYAKGGLFTKATLAGIGEAGKEAVLPLENRRTMSMIADSIMESGNIGVDEETLANAVAQGVAMAMMNNQGNTPPITVYAELKTESDEVLARAVTRGQQKIDYRNNPTIRFGY